MKFRGPNYTGIKEFDVYPDIKLTLGHVRLSILDLDARSNQPFVYNNSISIVFNGEVYNYKELTEQYKNSFMPMQFANMANPLAHIETTSKEK